MEFKKQTGRKETFGNCDHKSTKANVYGWKNLKENMAGTTPTTEWTNSKYILALKTYIVDTSNGND